MRRRGTSRAAHTDCGAAHAILAHAAILITALLCAGGFERSQVVADEQRMHSARTSSGSWLNGAKRDDVVITAGQHARRLTCCKDGGCVLVTARVSARLGPARPAMCPYVPVPAALQVRDVQRRIHQLVGIPEAFGESLYVLQYQAGQKYDAHTDHCASVRCRSSCTGVCGSADPCLTSSPCRLPCPALYHLPTPPAVPQSPDAAAAQSCQDFLKRAGGPRCGPGGGGVTCGDRLATFIMYLRCVAVQPAPACLPAHQHPLHPCMQVSTGRRCHRVPLGHWPG